MGKLSRNLVEYPIDHAEIVQTLLEAEKHLGDGIGSQKGNIIMSIIRVLNDNENFRAAVVSAVNPCL